MENIPQFTIKDIQIGVGDHEFDKAFSLYTKGAVSEIENNFYGFEAIVSGTHDYCVSLSTTSYDRGVCNCYIGQKDELCKHLLALAIATVYKYRPNDIEKIDQPLDQAVCSGEIREITKVEIKDIKAEINKALGFIKSYNGPSSKWFQYQDDLLKGSRLILLILTKLPVCEKSAVICVNLLKRLDKKLLNGGIDDSDGTMGDLMDQIVDLLNLFASSDENLINFIKKILPKGEAFDWEAGFNY